MDKNQEDGRVEHILRHYQRILNSKGLAAAGQYLEKHAPDLSDQAAVICNQPIATVGPSTFASMQSLGGDRGHHRPAGGYGESLDPD